MDDSIQKGSLSNSFNEQAKDKRLYHCIPLLPTGDEIRPSIGYGTEISREVREALGISQDEKVPLVFASDYISKAMAFAFNCREKEILLNAGIEDTDAELAIVCNRDITMSRPRQATVYSFSSIGFVHLSHSRQFVSQNPVAFDKAEKALEVRSTEDLMRSGLQVFSFKETFDELDGCHVLYDIIKEKNWSLNRCLSEMIKEGRVIWENHARGINPHPVLAERLNIKLPGAKPDALKPS